MKPARELEFNAQFIFQTIKNFLLQWRRKKPLFILLPIKLGALNQYDV